MAPKSKQVKGISALLFQVGLIASIFVVIVAFEWKFEDNSALVDSSGITEDLEELIDIPVTNQPPPPPPKIQQPQILEIPDEEEIEEEIDIDLDMEVEEEEFIPEVMISETDIEEETTEEIFTILEDVAEFEGGNAAFYRYISKNMKYPMAARRMGIEGKVFVSFVVEKDGSITNVQAIRGIGAGCDEEAVRVVKNSPKWNPGKQRGRPVRSRVIIPLIFTIGG